MNPETMKETVEALASGRITKPQFEALELFVSHCQKMTVRAKKTILYLLRNSDHLSRNLVLTIPYAATGDDDYGWGYETCKGHHDSSNMLYDVFCLIGTNMRLSHHGGAATQNEDRTILFESGWDNRSQKNIPVSTHGWSIFLAPTSFEMTNIEVLAFNREEILKTQLRREHSVFNTISGSQEYYTEASLLRRYANYLQ